MLIEDFKNFESVFGEYGEDLYTMIYSLNYCIGEIDDTLSILENMLAGYGLGGDNIGFSFPTTYDPWDKEYFEEGVEFQWGIKGVRVDNQTFYKYLKRAVEACISRSADSQKQEDAKKMLQEIRIKYGCHDSDSEDKILGFVEFDS